MMQQAFVHEFRNQPGVLEQRNHLDLAPTSSARLRSSRQIGDSPSFLWRDGTMGRITTDHTIEQEFIAAGVAPEIAGKYSHMLTRCLRLRFAECPARRVPFAAPARRPTPALHRRLDGHGSPTTRIAQCLDESPNAQSACDGLVGLALQAGGKDNVTAVLARAKSK